MSLVQVNGKGIDGYRVCYQKEIDASVQSLIARDCRSEEDFDRSITEEANQYGWYTSVNNAYLTLLTSDHADALETRLGYEDGDIFDLIARAATYAIEEDIIAALGGDYESYRERFAASEGPDEDDEGLDEA